MFAKGVIETIFYLGKRGKVGYYELYKQGFVVSRQTFANILKTLEKRGIIGRRVIDERPPRIEYFLTEKGREISKILEKLKDILESNGK